MRTPQLFAASMYKAVTAATSPRGGGGTVVLPPLGQELLRRLFERPQWSRRRLLAMVANAAAPGQASSADATTAKDANLDGGTDATDEKRVVPDDRPEFSSDIDMAELVAEHSDAVYRVALSVTRDPSMAEDVAQDALIKAWQALPSYRAEAPLRNWILRITHNTAISALRRRREETRDPVDLPEQISHSSIESTVQNNIAFDRFTVALDDLDSVSRSIVVLREVEGLSYDEICEVLDLTLPTVKTRLLRARRQLAAALEGWRP